MIRNAHRLVSTKQGVLLPKRQPVWFPSTSAGCIPIIGPKRGGRNVQPNRPPNQPPRNQALNGQSELGKSIRQTQEATDAPQTEAQTQTQTQRQKTARGVCCEE